jgi:peroxiredoxin/nitrogen regulatory protein PII-like uncharacterized protein
MRTVFIVILSFLTCISQAQDNTPNKTEYFIISNDSVTTMATVNKYAKSGDIKTVRKGVSDEEMKALKEKFGDKVSKDKQSIMMISLFTEEEKKQKESQVQQSVRGMDEENLLNVNNPAADFTVQMLDGTNVKLSDLKGKVVLINFWATWCHPCLKELHELSSKVLIPFKSKDFVFLAISWGEQKELVAECIANLQQEEGIFFTPGLDPDKKICNKYATVGIPKNFLIDKQGVIQYISSGYSERKVDEIANEIKKLLGN